MLCKVIKILAAFVYETLSLLVVKMMLQSILCFSLSLTAAFAATADFYTAAVYEHAHKLSPSETPVASRAEALQVMYPNLDVLEHQVLAAKAQGADLFVFPEDGLHRRLLYRDSIAAFAEEIPDPAKGHYSPCLYNFPPKDNEVFLRLSCVALKSSIYLAANMISKVPCLASTDPSCPYDGLYLYNTELVFDRGGCLVARYRKQNLVIGLEQEIYDVTKQPDYSYFDTDFGRFGVIICFDAFFKRPAVELVERYNVTNIIFSTAWTNINYNYNSVAYQSGWARAMKVNFLAANLHDHEYRFLGSGIYGPNGVINYTYDANSSDGKLVIARVPILRRSPQAADLPSAIKSISRPLTSSPLPTSSVLGNSSEILVEKFNLRLLSGYSGTTAVCMKNTCCEVSFVRSDTEELYAVGVFDGMHHRTGLYYWQICLLVHCPIINGSGICGSPISQKINTEFFNLTLTGTMPTKYVFPELITSDYDYSPQWMFENGNAKTIRAINKKLRSVALMGRNFDKDPESFA